jgi:hypothetical protein
LTAGQTKELTPITLDRLDRSVSGVVVDPRGRPVVGASISASYANGRPLIQSRFQEIVTGPDGRFQLDQLPDEPLRLMAYFSPPAGSTDLRIRFPAYATVSPGEKGARIVLDPKLSQRSAPIPPAVPEGGSPR